MSDGPVKLPRPDPAKVQELRLLFEGLWLNKPDDDTMRKHVAFFQSFPDEVKLQAWTALTSQGAHHFDKTKWIHRWLAESILMIFGVPMGVSGIGVRPREIQLYDEWSKKEKP